MVRQIKLILLCVTICLLQVKCADKNTDENRPYEFGFTIEGEQHRHEKKDENGIIMGEFGFITADGVYHVTVYATDENGGFKILSMKNIRVKPYPTAKAGSQKGRSLEFQPSKVTAPEQEKLPQKSHKPGPALPAKSCSHCSIPTTTTSTETPYTFNNDLSQISSISQDPDVPPKYDQIQDNYPQQIVNYQGNSQQQRQEQLQQQQQQELQQQQQITSNQYQDNKYHEKEITSVQNYPQSGINQKENYLKSTQEENYGQSYENPDADRYPTYNSDSQGETYPQSGVNRQSKSYEQEPHQPEISQENLPTRKPQLISAQMQIVDKNTDIHYKHPGEKEGLPDGLTKDDMSHLLYTFNYTVGFHGHFEEGYTNGAKQGYYYVTGRNGIKTRVDYVADEHGFRPKITQEVLDLLSDDVPKTETEKDPKYGLKGYEFKWIYYPVDTKRR